jgi:hypothetical protein
MLCRKKIKLPLLSFGTALIMWGAMSLFPHTGHAQIAGFPTTLDIQLKATAYCDDGSSSGDLDLEDSGKGTVTGTATVIFGTGSDKGEIEGTMRINWGSDGPGVIDYTFEGDSLAQDPKKGFFQLDAESAGDSDLLITGKYSLSKDGSQVKNASAVWQGEVDENGFDCFGSGKFKAKIRK